MSERITLGVQISQLMQGFARLFLNSVADWCRSNDVNLIIITSKIVRDQTGERRQYSGAFDHIKKGVVDAVVSTSGIQLNYQPLEQHLDRLRSFNVPVVSISAVLDGYPSIIVDNRIGMHEGIKHLALEHGYHRIAHLRGPMGNWEAGERFAAYHDAVSRYGLDDDEALCIRGDFTQVGARWALERYFEQHGAFDFDALCAANDEMGLTAIEVFKEHGYEMPGDIAVIGFDDTVFSRCTSPLLTTVRQPVYDVGQKAAATAATLARGGSVPEVQTFPTHLVVRNSCGCQKTNETPDDPLIVDSGDIRGLSPELRWNELPNQLVLYRLVMERIVSASTVDELMEYLAGQLSNIDIDVCFIAHYLSDRINENNNISNIPREAEILLAYVDGKRLDSPEKLKRFSVENVLVPPEYLPNNRRTTLLTTEIYFKEQQVGYIVLEPGNYDISIYENLCIQLGSIIWNTMLVAKSRKNEAEIRTALSRWQATFDAVQDSVMLLDTERRIIEMNRAALAMFGRIEKPMTDDQQCCELLHLPGAIKQRCPFERAKRSLKRETIELQFNDRWLSISVDPILDENGHFAGGVHITHDSTVRKKNEEELRKLSAAMKQSPVLMAILDSTGRIEYVNPRFEEFSGYALSEIKGFDTRTAASDVFPLELRQEIWDEIEKGDAWRGEFQNKKKDGTVYWARAALSPIRIEGGETTHVLAAIEDITSQKTLENQIRQAQKMESVGRLAGGVAHDFNNMLTVILGHSGAALEKIDPESDLTGHLHEIAEAAQRSSELTGQLLAFARKQAIRPIVQNLNDTISGQLGILRRLIGEEIKLVWKPGADLWPVCIDPIQVTQILMNLSVNARDAITGVGTVTIRTSNLTIDRTYSLTHPEFLTGDFIMLAVSDTGCGMDQESLEHLFEPFYTSKEPGKGTGLGLSTVYGIIKQNGGFINVYSEPGHGTLFRIYIARSQGEPRAVDSEEEHKPTGGDETILIVEDEVAILNLARSILIQRGYRVLTAKTPGEAISCAEKLTGKIDLLITDVIMPEMNGSELRDRLARLRADMKTLFMSGYTADLILDQDDIDSNFRLLQKPFSIKTLTETVRDVLDTRNP